MARSQPRGFTLVEMLVVIGIIAVLAALLLPAVMSAVGRARNAAIAYEVMQLNDAIESYKKDKGDYPPSFRDTAAFERHLRRCYPKIAPNEYASMFTKDSNGNIDRDTNGNPKSFAVPLDEGEALVFWLSRTFVDARYPFSANGNTNADRKIYYDFEQPRLLDSDSNTFPSYKAKYCKDTCYLYIDSRSYDNPRTEAADLGRFQSVDGADTYAYFEDSADPKHWCRPYWSQNLKSSGQQSPPERDKYQPMNPKTFQILCAGQDGDFGVIVSPEPNPDNEAKFFPGGGEYNDGDADNITNFSNGGKLEDQIP